MATPSFVERLGALEGLDSVVDKKDTYISAFLLVGVGANAVLGWWWADPIAGLCIAALAAKEGHELWTTEDFCAH